MAAKAISGQTRSRVAVADFRDQVLMPRPARQHNGSRLVPPLLFIAAGALFVTSALVAAYGTLYPHRRVAALMFGAAVLLFVGFAVHRKA